MYPGCTAGSLRRVPRVEGSLHAQRVPGQMWVMGSGQMAVGWGGSSAQFGQDKHDRLLEQFLGFRTTSFWTVQQLCRTLPIFRPHITAQPKPTSQTSSNQYNIYQNNPSTQQKPEQPPTNQTSNIVITEYQQNQNQKNHQPNINQNNLQST